MGGDTSLAVGHSCLPVACFVSPRPYKRPAVPTARCLRQMPTKRRLPLFDSAPASAEGTPGHWVLAMAALAFTLWLPLALLAVWVAQAVVGHAGDPGAGGPGAAFIVVGLLLGSFFMASSLAAALVRGTTTRASAADVVGGGVLAALASCAVALAAGELGQWSVAAVSVLVLGLTGALGGALGGRIGRRWAGRRSVRVDPTRPTD